MISPIVRFLRFASLAVCAIVVVSFAFFVVDQSRSASAHQTQEITTGTLSSNSHTSKPAKESEVHKTIDEASEELTSPFAGVISGSSNEWVVRGVKLLLALAVYGFGFGFLARAVRVRT